MMVIIPYGGSVVGVKSYDIASMTIKFEEDGKLVETTVYVGGFPNILHLSQGAEQNVVRVEDLPSEMIHEIVRITSESIYRSAGMLD